MTIRACKRCGVRPGIPSHALAKVGDALPVDTIEEHISLCSYCRGAAQRENEIARKRRGRRAKWGQWTIRNERLLVFP